MSNFLEKNKKGNKIIGTMISEITTPNIVRILASVGFEFVIIDCEHGYFDFSQIAAMTGVAGGAGLSVIVRLADNQRSGITKYLDMGVDGLLLPMTNTKEDIQQVVNWAKYPPIGKRGISLQRAHTNYTPPPLAEYLQTANKRTMIFPQIETKEGVANIEEILQVEGIDGVFVGPNDLSIDFAAPGNYNTEAVTNAIDSVIVAAQKLGKPSGVISGDVRFIKDMESRGMTLFSCNSEIGMIKNGGEKIISDLK